MNGKDLGQFQRPNHTSADLPPADKAKTMGSGSAARIEQAVSLVRSSSAASLGQPAVRSTPPAHQATPRGDQGVAKPYLAVVFLFGPAAQRLAAAVRDDIPRLDAITKDAARCFVPGNPRHSGSRFREELRSLGIEMVALRDEWAAIEAEFGQMATAQQSNILETKFGVASSDLPCVLVFGRHDELPLVMHLPPASWDTDAALVELLGVFREWFSDERLGRAFASAEARFPAGFNTAFNEYVAGFRLRVAAIHLEAMALHEDFVTLDQAAAHCGRSKKTLERYLDKELIPQPDIRGGGGKASSWKWSTLRPALEAVTKRVLPGRPFSRRIV